jgi:hypothetical protein
MGLDRSGWLNSGSATTGRGGCLVTETLPIASVASPFMLTRSSDTGLTVPAGADVPANRRFHLHRMGVAMKVIGLAQTEFVGILQKCAF